MSLQTARELLHAWNRARGNHGTAAGEKGPEATVKENKKDIQTENKHPTPHPSPAANTKPSTLQQQYASDSWRNERSTIGVASDCLSLTVCMAAFQHRASRVLALTAERVNAVMAGGQSFDSAYEAAKVDLVRCAKAHCWSIILHNFIDALSNVRDASLLPVLTTLARLFALSHIERELGDFTEDGYLNVTQCALIRQSVRDLLPIVRVDAVAIVDSFDFSDHYLNSALGKWDGNVYEALYKWANTSNPMNDSDVAPGVERILLPLMREGRRLAEEEQKKEAATREGKERGTAIPAKL